MKRKILSWIFSALFIVAATPPATALEVGEKAPGFELPSTNGGNLNLNSFLGKKNVVIQFYVLDFSPG